MAASCESSCRKHAQQTGGINLASFTTAVGAPNMNSVIERFFRTLRREGLDNFLLPGRSQIQRIPEE
jgi:transposase InsO family protein